METFRASDKVLDQPSLLGFLWWKSNTTTTPSSWLPTQRSPLLQLLSYSVSKTSNATLLLPDATHFSFTTKQRYCLYWKTCSVSLYLYCFQESWCRLIILYILYALYADTSLERNPFLTFFLEFVTDNAQRGDVLEKRFVNCILDGSITSVWEDEMDHWHGN